MGLPVLTMLDSLPHLFTTDDLLAVGVQAPLDLAIDDEAVLLRAEYVPVPKPMPGQMRIEE
jgi:hypothetical protein